MDRIEKALAKLSERERRAVKEILRAILAGKLVGFDFKKLKGHDHLYRVRKGQIRIIFLRRSADDISVLSIERRSDTTYHHL